MAFLRVKSFLYSYNQKAVTLLRPLLHLIRFEVIFKLLVILSLIWYNVIVAKHCLNNDPSSHFSNSVSIMVLYRSHCCEIFTPRLCRFYSRCYWKTRRQTEVDRPISRARIRSPTSQREVHEICTTQVCEILQVCLNAMYGSRCVRVPEYVAYRAFIFRLVVSVCWSYRLSRTRWSVCFLASACYSRWSSRTPVISDILRPPSGVPRNFPVAHTFTVKQKLHSSVNFTSLFFLYLVTVKVALRTGGSLSWNLLIKKAH
jgi:hypothetical protein